MLEIKSDRPVRCLAVKIDGKEYDVTTIADMNRSDARAMTSALSDGKIGEWFEEYLARFIPEKVTDGIANSDYQAIASAWFASGKDAGVDAGE